jgi:hypothetical protein
MGTILQNYCKGLFMPPYLSLECDRYRGSFYLIIIYREKNMRQHIYFLHCIHRFVQYMHIVKWADLEVCKTDLSTSQE